MDEFISSVKSQTFYMDAFDELISSVYIPCYYWFENTACSDTEFSGTFMAPEILRNSFYQALQAFPILAGRFKTEKNSRGCVKVDKNNLNMPEYTDSCWDIDFQQTKATGFNTNLLPETFHSACGVTAATRFATTSAKLGIFHIRRFKKQGGVLVFVGIAHALVDGYGEFAFMSRWTEISQWMHDKTKPTPSTEPFIHDRAIHAGYRIHNTQAINKLTLEAVASASMLSKFLSRLSIGKRNILYKAITKPSQFACCSFHIPANRLQELHESVQECAPAGTRLSANDVITALINMVIGQAVHNTRTDKHGNRFLSRITCSLLGSKSPRLETLAAFAVNMRPRTKHPDAMRFVGNLSFVQSVLLPTEAVQAEPSVPNLLAIASEIRKSLLSMDTEYVGQLNYLLNKEPDTHMRLAIHNAQFKNRIMVSCISKVGHYSLDFGDGTPLLARPLFRSYPNTVFIMPSHPDLGGCDVVMSLDRDVANLIVNDKNWMRLVDTHAFDI
ncbi:hypothetical protein H4217_006169 [Coemansia sp. RSA 1939]|nr:hypothetical protein H4217_006169 [Coemansia sp. RSA 1939]